MLEIYGNARNYEYHGNLESDPLLTFDVSLLRQLNFEDVNLRFRTGEYMYFGKTHFTLMHPVIFIGNLLKISWIKFVTYLFIIFPI